MGDFMTGMKSDEAKRAADGYFNMSDDEREEYDSPVDGEREERRETETQTGGGRCRIRKNVSPETGSTTYFSTLKLCQAACPWCKDVEKYDDIS